MSLSIAAMSLLNAFVRPMTALINLLNAFIRPVTAFIVAVDRVHARFDSAHGTLERIHRPLGFD